jgi:hypothetical protein
MSATITPGGPGEDGYVKLTVHLTLTTEELLDLSTYLADRGFYDVQDAMADDDEDGHAVACSYDRDGVCIVCGDVRDES